MAEAVYISCALTSIACAVMLFRGYMRTKARFLVWCGLCFAFLAANNALLFVDRVVFPDQTLEFLNLDFAVWRSIAAFCGLSLLVVGLVWDTD
jgi:hypothetical protein